MILINMLTKKEMPGGQVERTDLLSDTNFIP